ncbi:hypothetical protein GCM10010503_15680 [Streptomyces lucensis JCM 4490]|uniref:Uncharacterized protein n=1 Tax=Streptomyces lucensis JCM 4490 TaxID=1306176 RepID=A0A918IZ93_9ACTN|nr:hypothetical protein [Streptomyces lucensis]GGW40101.1 hypothetical protein GCM10010503_15680 [Streptomyces lucensis JCM 4490]
MALSVGLDGSPDPPEPDVSVGLDVPLVSVESGVLLVSAGLDVSLVPVEEGGSDEEGVAGDDWPGEVPGVEEPGDGGDESPGEGGGGDDAAGVMGSARAAAAADAPVRYRICRRGSLAMGNPGADRKSPGAALRSFRADIRHTSHSSPVRRIRQVG